MKSTLQSVMAILRSHYKEGRYEIVPGQSMRCTHFTITPVGTYRNMTGFAALVKRSLCLKDLRALDKLAFADDTKTARGELVFIVALEHPLFKTWDHVRSFIRSKDPERVKFGVAFDPMYVDGVQAGVLITAALCPGVDASEALLLERELREGLDACGVDFTVKFTQIPARPPLVHKPIRNVRVSLPLMADGTSLVPRSTRTVETETVTAHG